MMLITRKFLCCWLQRKLHEVPYKEMCKATFQFAFNTKCHHILENWCELLKSLYLTGWEHICNQDEGSYHHLLCETIPWWLFEDLSSPCLGYHSLSPWNREAAPQRGTDPSQGRNIPSDPRHQGTLLLLLGPCQRNHIHVL